MERTYKCLYCEEQMISTNFWINNQPYHLDCLYENFGGEKHQALRDYQLDLYENINDPDYDRIPSFWQHPEEETRYELSERDLLEESHFIGELESIESEFIESPYRSLSQDSLSGTPLRWSHFPSILGSPAYSICSAYSDQLPTPNSQRSRSYVTVQELYEDPQEWEYSPPHFINRKRKPGFRLLPQFRKK